MFAPIRSARGRRAPFGVVALALLLAVPAGARAQALGMPGGMRTQPIIQLGVGGGVVVPTSDARQALKQGIHAKAFTLINVLPGFPLKFDLGYQRFNLKQAVLDGQAAQSGNQQILSGVGGTQIYLIGGPIRPYLTAGVGAFDIRSALAGQTTTSQIKFGVNGGAGLQIKLGPISAFVEGTVQNVFRSDSGFVSRKNIQSVPVSFGLLFF